MGIKINHGVFKRNGRNTHCAFLYWDGEGDSTVLTISQIAEQICGRPSEVFLDITHLTENQKVAEELWNKYAQPYIKRLEKKTDQRKKIKEILGLIGWLSGPGDDSSGEIKSPSAYLNSKLKRRIVGLTLVKSYGAKFEDWKVDLKSVNYLMLTPEMNQTEWNKCRASGSVAKSKKEEVEKYKSAVKKLNPYLDKMEQAIENYEKTTRKWTLNKKGGKSFLEGLAIMNLVERITDIYTGQDRRVEDINALSKELLEHGGIEYERQLRRATKKSLNLMRGLYFDGKLNQALYEYLKIWDPSHHYYFHSTIAKSVGAPTKKKGKSDRFDERLFQAVDKLAQYLSSDPQTAEKVGEEASKSIKKIWEEVDKLAKQRKLDSRNPIEGLKQKADAMYSKLQSETKPGILSTFAVWSGYICTWAGNFEGPPSVLSLILVRFSNSQHFVKILENDTLLKAFVMFGIDQRERATIERLLKSGSESDIQQAREFFVNASWRSPSIYVVYCLMGLAILIYHVDGLVEKLEKDGDRSSFDAELIKRVAVITQDVASLGLTYLTIKYSRDLNAFLAENANASTSALANKITTLEKHGWRVAAVKGLHGTMAFLGVALSIWDLNDNWGKSDNFELLVLGGTVASSLMCFLGVLGVASWLGPVGFLLGVVLGVIFTIYQWFKSGIEKTLRSLLDVFEKSEFYKKHENLQVKGWVFVILIIPSQRRYYHVMKELNKAVAKHSWAKPKEADAIRYFRAGLIPKTLVRLYELDEDDIYKIKGLLAKQRHMLAERQKRKMKFEIQMLEPGATTKLYVGALSTIRVAVNNHKSIDHIWLDPRKAWYNNEPDRYLAEHDPRYIGVPRSEDYALNCYDVTKNAVILRRIRKTKHSQIFGGGIRVQEIPPKNIVQFDLKVPKDKTRWTPDGHFPHPYNAKKLQFSVIKA